MATFQVKINDHDEYYFNLVSDQEDLILRSESYSTKLAYLHGIESVQSNADDEARYERMVAEDGQFYCPRVLRRSWRQLAGAVARPSVDRNGAAGRGTFGLMRASPEAGILGRFPAGSRHEHLD